MTARFLGRPRLSYASIFAALCLLTPLSARATIFNWPDGGWTAGTPGPGQTATQSFTSINPNDITVSVNNNGVSASGGTFQTAYPQIDSTTSTGGFTGVTGLQLYLTAQSATNSYIRTTVSFASAVTDVTFQLWDVDMSDKQFIDTIFNIQALAAGGGTVGANSVTSAVPGYNSITGTGLSTVVTGIATASNSTNQGTIDITFNGPITQFSFDWSNGDSHLGAQAIGLGPISYLPEATAGPASAGVCALAVTAHQLIKRRRRKNSLG